MRWARIALAAVGIAMVAFGVSSAVGSADFTPFRHGLFLVLVLIGNELLLMPAFIGVGAIVRRVVPGRYRAVVQGGLIVTAAVTVVALPLVAGFGRRPDIPSALPRDYLGGYALVLGFVWLVAGVLLVRRRLSAARRVSSPRSG